MRDQFKHDVVNARQPYGGTVTQARQFPAVTPGQMAPGHLDLLFNQVEIVQHPFGGGGEALGWSHPPDHSIEGPQNLLILVQLGQQVVGAAAGGELMAFGQGAGVPRELLDAEEFVAQRRLARPRARLPCHPGLPA